MAARLQIQARLKELGLYTAAIDGLWGRGTRSAIERYALLNGKSGMLVTLEGSRILLSEVTTPPEAVTVPQYQVYAVPAATPASTPRPISSTGSVLDPGTASRTESSSDSWSVPGRDAPSRGEPLYEEEPVIKQGPLSLSDSTAREVDQGSTAVDVERPIHTYDIPSDSKEGMEELTKRLEDIQEQIAILTAVLENQKERPESEFKEAKIGALIEQITLYKTELNKIRAEANNRYRTPIYPENSNWGVTAIKASENFPRIPYYVPGTKEIGDMWIAPRVTDEGKLIFDFTFMDPGADYAKIGSSHESVQGETHE